MITYYIVIPADVDLLSDDTMGNIRTFSSRLEAESVANSQARHCAGHKYNVCKIDVTPVKEFICELVVKAEDIKH